MTEDIKGLIEKIQQEGVEAGEAKSKQIEAEARNKADEIIKKAKADAQRYLDEAKESIEKLRQGSDSSLKQTARDILLNLKNEIKALLGKVITEQVNQALKPQELAKIIADLIREHKGSEKAGTFEVTLKKEDLKLVEEGLIAEFKHKLKEGIYLKSSESISGGFIISYDSGKSHFDFTDEALSEYLSGLLKDGLGELLKKNKQE